MYTPVIQSVFRYTAVFNVQMFKMLQMYKPSKLIREIMPSTLQIQATEITIIKKFYI